MGVEMSANSAMPYKVVIDVTNKTARVTLNNSTTKEFKIDEVSAVDTVKFTTATAARNIIVGDVSVSYAALTVTAGDANCNGNVDSFDAALILKYLAGATTLSDKGILNAAAMTANTSTLDILDAIAIIESLNSDDGNTDVTAVYDHNFTTDGTTSTFYTISGNTSAKKGTATYNGSTLTTCLKMETSTSISFTGKGTLTLVFASTEDEENVKVDGITYTTDSNARLTVYLDEGTHTITKGDSINLFYISFAAEK
jgi:hypothetical protein